MKIRYFFFTLFFVFGISQAQAAVPAKPAQLYYKFVAANSTSISIAYHEYWWQPIQGAKKYRIFAKGYSSNTHQYVGKFTLTETTDTIARFDYTVFDNAALAFESTVDSQYLNECVDGTCTYKLAYHFYLVAINDDGEGAEEEFSVVNTTGLHAATKEQNLVYPNPAMHTLHIKGKSQRGMPYAIYNTQGQLVKQGHVSPENEIAIPNLAKGNYYLKMEGITVPFIKMD